MKAATPVVSLSPAMERLIAGVRQVARDELDPQRAADSVAALLRTVISNPDLLAGAHLEPDPERYRQHIVHCEPDGSFSVVALVWLPGQATPVHDHVCWCVVGVHQGQEHETRFRLLTEGRTRLVPRDQCVNELGSVAALAPPGDIHRVMNSGQSAAVSIHVYGADIHRLGSSIRRTYDFPVSQD